MGRANHLTRVTLTRSLPNQGSVRQHVVTQCAYRCVKTRRDEAA